MVMRPSHRRKQDFKPGKVTGWPEGSDPEAASGRARYIADGMHKSYPSPSGEWTFVANSDGMKCPPIAVERWGALQTALRDAMRVGVVGGELRGEFPARVWVFLDSKLCEARLSNHLSGEYHGFPLEYEENHPADPHGLLVRAPRIEL